MSGATFHAGSAAYRVGDSFVIADPVGRHHAVTVVAVGTRAITVQFQNGDMKTLAVRR